MRAHARVRTTGGKGHTKTLLDLVHPRIQSRCGNDDMIQIRGQNELCVYALRHGNGFFEIARLIDVRALGHGHMVGQ